MASCDYGLKASARGDQEIRQQQLRKDMGNTSGKLLTTIEKYLHDLAQLQSWSTAK